MSADAPFPLRRGRVHEVLGPGAFGFSLLAIAQTDGPALWIREGWRSGGPDPLGLARILDPDRLLIAKAADQTDALAVAEEALKDGATGFVVIEITRPLDLREGRRLQLAARAGQATGLCLIPEGMGSNASETRWRASPVFDPGPPDMDRALMRWELLKNKSGAAGAWQVRWHHGSPQPEWLPLPTDPDKEKGPV